VSACRLRCLPQRHGIPQAFESLDRPLALTYLLFGTAIIVPRLLITSPLGKEMGDDHEHVVGHRQCRLLFADAHFEAAKSLSEAGGRFPRPPGTLPQEPTEGAIPLARFAAVPFPATLVIAWAHPCPRGEAGGVAKAVHVRSNLGEHIPGGRQGDPGNTVELRDLGLQGRHQRANLLIEVSNLAVSYLDKL